MEYQKIIKHGNSRAVVIPIEMCRELGINIGDQVRICGVLSKGVKGEPKVMYLEIWPVFQPGQQVTVF